MTRYVVKRISLWNKYLMVTEYFDSKEEAEKRAKQINQLIGYTATISQVEEE